jgi:rhodanese-related sulfurtransferase
MISGLIGLFKKQPTVNYAAMVQEGAQIVDVRTPQEFGFGHIEGSKNIPLQTLQSSLIRLDKKKVIITCCASGVRSANARKVLLANGFEHVYNGGGWLGLDSKL